MKNQTGVIGFHIGPGGNKNGIGDWMRQLNDAGIAFPIKSADQYGVIGEALAVGLERGVNNWLVYRMTEEVHGAAGVRNVPDYTLPPLDAAVKHCLPLIQALPPEFDKTAVYIEIVNEVRMKKAPNEAQYQDMNAADWMGEFCYEAAVFMNERGYKIAAPAINSGEPGLDMEDVVTQYSMDGMLRFIHYAANNSDMCILSVHEYIWDNWKDGQKWEDWYPHLLGRFEGLVAAADNARIPRTFKCLVSEFGFGRDNAPRWEDAKPIIAQYSEWMARFPQIVGTSAWTLQGGWGGVDNDVQSWIEPLINYTINERPQIATQPQITHQLFGSTLPFQEPDMPKINSQTIQIPIGTTEFKIQFINAFGMVVDPAITFDEEMLPTGVVVTSTIDDGIWPTPPLLTIAPNSMGVDVSAHQKEFDWDLAVTNGITYAIIRSSNGLGSSSTDANGRDKWLYRNASELTRLGIPWAIYHFLQEGQDIDKQSALVMEILADLKQRGTYPLAAVLPTGAILPTVFNDVERFGLTAVHVKSFHRGLNAPTGIYTRKSVWDVVMAGADVWWADLPCWVAAYSKDDDGTPPPWKPFVPLGFPRNELWQYTSRGGWLVDSASGLDLNIASPFEGETIPPIEPPDPPAVTFDALPYLRGGNGVQLDIDAGTYTQTLNTQHGDSDTWRLIKGGNGQYEYLYADANFIYRREDTSQGDDRFYCHYTNGVQGAAWIDRHAEIGTSYISSKTVTHYWNDCTIRLDPVGRVVDTIKVVAVHDTYTFARTGKTLNDVLELLWVEGGETYLFANGLGLVGFKDANQEAQFMGQLHGREPLSFKRPSCIDEDERFYA